MGVINYKLGPMVVPEEMEKYRKPPTANKSIRLKIAVWRQLSALAEKAGTSTNAIMGAAAEWALSQPPSAFAEMRPAPEPEAPRQPGETANAYYARKNAADAERAERSSRWFVPKARK